jgi:hypothetical protein
MKRGVFPNYKYQLIVYDYKDSRRFMWEDKKFMSDVNVLRDHDFLIRARLNTKDYRSINTHQCTNEGEKYLKETNYSTTQGAKDILRYLTCKCKRLYRVRLDDDMPRLVCEKCKQTLPVKGFLNDLDKEINFNLDVAFI